MRGRPPFRVPGPGEAEGWGSGWAFQFHLEEAPCGAVGGRLLWDGVVADQRPTAGFAVGSRRLAEREGTNRTDRHMPFDDARSGPVDEHDEPR